MKTYILAVCLIVFASGLSCETIVQPGAVQGSWNADGSPYRIMGDINIPNGAALHVGPGVNVIFHGTYRFDVMGQLVCAGLNENHVVFTAQDTLMGWQSVRFNNTAQTNPPSSFDYTEFNFGKAINGTSSTDPINEGGAVWAVNAGTLTFNNCKFNRCKSMGDGSVICASAATNITMTSCSIKRCETEWFGAICVRNGAVNIQDTEFVNNYSNVFGAAMYLSACSAVNLISCTFMSNAAGALGGIYCLYSPLVIKNSFFLGNYTDTGRGGAIGVTHGTTTITNCTFVGNTTPMDGGAIWFNLLDAPPVITNSIFWDNLPDAISAITTTYQLFYCSMQVPQGGPTNIWGNPFFSNAANDNYTLSPVSPCIDTGTPDPAGLDLPQTDLAGLPRVADGNMDTVFRIDMGCYELPGAPPVGEIAGQVIDMQGQPVAGATITTGSQTAVSNTWGLYSFQIEQGTYNVTCLKQGYVSVTHYDVAVTIGHTSTVNFSLGTVDISDQTNIPALASVCSNPSPFRDNTNISFSLSKSNPVRIEIYNIKGQKVRTLFDAALSAGDHQIAWDGSDDYHIPMGNGIYLCRLVCEKETLSLRLFKM
jgi:hypothetical protein